MKDRIKLFPYQREAVKFLKGRDRSMLRLDTGLGKTCVAITYAEELSAGGKFKVLVVVPAFLKANWKSEIGKFCSNSKIEWNLVSYTSLSSVKSKQLQYLSQDETSFDLMICDESHYIKNWSAARTKNLIRKVMPRCSKVLLLTATPYVRSAEDLHTQFSICEPGAWGSLGKFREKFCKWKPNPFVQNVHAKIWYGVKNAEELKERSKSFMFSRSKADVQIELPEKIVSDFDIEVSKEHRLDELEREAYVDDRGNVAGGLGSILSKANAELGVEKVKHVVEFLDNVSEKKFVVFCKHKEVAEILSGLLQCERITGDTPMNKRNKIVEEFQNGDRNAERLVCTIGACGVGINLFAASLAVFAELPWSYAELKQCEDRLHRIGQKKNVMIYRFIANGTIDELIVKQLNDKFAGEEGSVGVMA